MITYVPAELLRQIERSIERKTNQTLRQALIKNCPIKAWYKPT